jgi:Domain of unknown function (DUF6457)
MNKEEWLAAFCEKVGVEAPSAEEADRLLELAAVAAHASERPAAPLACWAAGRSGRPAAELVRAARQVSGES